MSMLFLFVFLFLGFIDIYRQQNSCILSDDECPLDYYCNTTTQFCQLSNGYNLSRFYLFNQDGDRELSPIDDGFYNLSVSQTFQFLGDKYSYLVLSTNGLLSFGSEYIDPTPGDFLNSSQSPATFIAIYWTDIDITGMIASGNGNRIFLRETFNTSITSRFSNEINSLYLPNYNTTGLSTFNCTSVVVATWLRVGHYRKVNTTLSTFQLVLGLSNVSAQQNFTFVMFHYNSLRWAEVDNDFARAGFKRFDLSTTITTDAYELPGSGTPQVQNIQTTSNVGVPGKWIFRVDQPIGVPSQPPFVPPSPPSPPPPSPPLVPTSPPIYFVPVSPPINKASPQISPISTVAPTVIRPPKFVIDVTSSGMAFHVHSGIIWKLLVSFYILISCLFFKQH